MRLEARIKMGYYPTPLSVVERIKTFVKFPNERVSILDPCCGEGSAVQKLVKRQNAVTYGIELDKHRAEEAKGKINHVLHCSYDATRITNGCFSMLFLNPPYDEDTLKEEDEKHTERKEKAFLRGTIKYLQSNGLLIYIIPQKRLDKSIAKILSYRFEHFKVFRFEDGEYETFKQIVLFATKKKTNSVDETSFISLSKIPFTELPEIPFADRPRYLIPPSKEIPLFKSAVLNEEELETEVADSLLWRKFRDLVRTDTVTVQRPPLPLHTGHLSLLLASGMLDGVVGEGKDRHVVRGKVEKTVTTCEEMHGDVLEERKLEQYKVSIKVLKQDGEIITLI